MQNTKLNVTYVLQETPWRKSRPKNPVIYTTILKIHIHWWSKKRHKVNDTI